jgi:predicted metal-binding membrane protein
VSRAGARPGFLPLAAALLALSWIALWLWGESPYARYLDHGNWTGSGTAAALCRAFPIGARLLPFSLSLVGWLLMTAAMMLPTVLPLLDRFQRIVRQRPDRRHLIALVIGGYLTVWAGFGAAAHLLDAGLHAAVHRSDWLLFNGWAIGALILAVAGLFQFSRLKYRCLVQCRAPFGFIARHWRGPGPRRHAFALGLDHGVFCVGCCWAIMLVMFAVGTGNLGWMLALGAIMAAEKNAPWGERLSRPLGAVLLAGAVLTAGLNIVGLNLER